MVAFITSFLTESLRTHAPRPPGPMGSSSGAKAYKRLREILRPRSSGGLTSARLRPSPRFATGFSIARPSTSGLRSRKTTSSDGRGEGTPHGRIALRSSFLSGAEPCRSPHYPNSPWIGETSCFPT